MAKNQLLKMGAVTAAALGALIFFAGCGPKDENPSTPADTAGTTGKTPPADSTAVNIDGSTTVFPIVNAMGEDFAKANSGAKVVVNKSGTGSGFQKFERGEIDIATASRAIKSDEVEALKKASIDFIEIPIAYDGVSVIVPPSNTWATSLTVDELKKAWSGASTVKLWSDIRPSFPKEPIKFYGPTDNHGTYEYFTEAINGKKNEIRKEYNSNQDYNAIVNNVAGDKGGIGYVGFNYFIENKDKVKAVGIDNGKSGAVLPSEETIAKGTYVPLSRPLFLYVNKKSLDSKENVKKFVDYALNAGITAVSEAKYVQLPADALDAVKKHVTDGKTGSVFIDAKPGMTIGEVLAKETAAK